MAGSHGPSPDDAYTASFHVPLVKKGRGLSRPLSEPGVWRFTVAKADDLRGATVEGLFWYGARRHAAQLLGICPDDLRIASSPVTP